MDLSLNLLSCVLFVAKVAPDLFVGVDNVGLVVGELVGGSVEKAASSAYGICIAEMDVVRLFAY